MAQLELEESEIPARKSMALGKATTLNSGDKFKMELGDDELNESIPVGEIWHVSVQIQVSVETL